MKKHFLRVLGWMRLHTLALALVLLLGAVMTPVGVQSQISPCCTILAAGLATINSTLSTVIGGGLSAINGILTTIQQFEQQVVWPAQAIAQARALVGSIQGIYTQIKNIFNIPISSATLANPRQLEAILLSRSPGQISSTPGSYSAVYGVVPLPQNASPEVRDLVDVTDAVAQDAMERAIAIDAIADQELKAADQINTSIQSAAPGSAPIIEAQADAWLVRANAYTQSALADLMRVRAIDLSNSGAMMKFGSSGAVGTQQDVNTVLKRK
ncbi:MAG TPA: hypothetical protein VEU11_05895 [Terriglobales bacterium]|nr:hypothetical protein [Terriglobales bacterium]